MRGWLALDRSKLESARREDDEPVVSSRAPRWGVAALVGALIAAALHAWWHAGFTVDDAGTSYTYARSFADGIGLGVLHAGGARVEGYSNFLWVLLLAGARALGIPIGAAAKALGAASLIGSAWLLHSILVRIVRRSALLWATLLLPLTTCVALWSMSGLESGLYALLLLGATRLLMYEETRPSWWNLGSALALVLAALTRPDAFVFAAAAVASKVVGLIVTREERVRRAAHLAAWLALLTGAYGAYLGWHVAFFGFVFPNTVYAKGASPSLAQLVRQVLHLDSDGWKYVRAWMWERGGLALIPAALVGTFSLLRGPSRAIAAFGAAALVLPLFFPDWMVEHRFLVPFVPFAVALSVAGLDALLDVAGRLGGSTRKVQFALVGAAALLSVLYIAVNVRASVARRSSRYAATASMDEVRAMYGKLFEAPVGQLGLRDPLFAIPDIGATSFDLHMHILDIGGLADANIAHAGGEPEQLELYLFDERRPDLIHAHGVWLLYSQLRSLSGLSRDYVMLDSRRGPALEDNSLEAVRKDLFLDPLPSGWAATPLAGDVALVGIEGPEAVERNTALPFDVFLTSTKPGPSPVEISINVVRPDGTVAVAQQVPCGPSFYPCRDWAAGERVRERVVVTLGHESGPLALQILAREGTSEWRVRFSRTLVVDSGSANAYARQQQAIARFQAASADIAGMEHALDLAEAAAPALTKWDAERAACRVAAAHGSAERAKACIAVGDWGCADKVLKGTDRLGGARAASLELRDLAPRILTAAKKEDDPTLAYLMYRAAWFANPQDATAQRGLIEARRAYVAAFARR
jgi:hypothetical protein